MLAVDPGLEGVSTKLSVRVRGGKAGLAAADSGERTGVFWASLIADLAGNCTGGDPDDVAIDKVAILSFTDAGDEVPSLKVLFLFGSIGGPDTALGVSGVLIGCFDAIGPSPGRATPALPPNFRSPSSTGVS